VIVWWDPAVAVLLGWLVAMTTRQAGHLFFEPRGYDHVNEATDEHKEAIKVGYNIRRKIVLLAIWAASPHRVERREAELDRLLALGAGEGHRRLAPLLQRGDDAVQSSDLVHHRLRRPAQSGRNISSAR
jgi:hypothetical protein